MSGTSQIGTGFNVSIAPEMYAQKLQDSMGVGQRLQGGVKGRHMGATALPGQQQTHLQQQQQQQQHQQQQQGNSQRPPIGSDEYLSIGSGVMFSADMKAAHIAVTMCTSLTGTRNCQPERSYGGLYDAVGGGGSINGSVGGSDGNKIF